MKKLFCILAFCGFAMISFGQTGSIKGTVRDTLEKRTLPDAVISLLNSSDSVLVKYTRADTQGNFEINKLTAGTYVLLVTYPKFADFADHITITNDKPLDMGTIALTPKSLLLNEVIVRANLAMRLRGDTTEFTADSFKVREGATVEDLLKQLPGIQVNSKGEITTQGQRVDKILVDGEEFFGADPTVATQNIQARAVDKVQMYDTKSEQDQLKGIGSTGQGSKTLNIKLKESAKKGYFGSAMASTDFKNLLNAKAMINKFKGNEKFSIYGTKSNISTGALGYSERSQLGLEQDLEYDELNGYYYSYGDAGGEDFNDWSLRGLPNAYTLGALYGNKWNQDKQKLNLYYLYNRLQTTNTTRTISQTLLGDSINLRTGREISRGLSQRHVANVKYEWKIDSLASIKYTGAGTYSLKDSYNDNYSETSNDRAGLLNDNSRINNMFSTKKQFDNVLTYSQLFKKKDRKLITTLRLGLINDEQDGLLVSTTRFYENNILDSIDNIDQKKINTGNSTSIGARVTFNEPLTAEWNLVTEYSYNQNNSTSHRNSFNKDLNHDYTQLDPLFSNNFDLKAFSNSGTLTARYIGKKWRTAFGAGLSAIQLNLNNLDNTQKSKYNFVGFTPQSQVSYTIKPQNTISFNYRGSTVQPTLSQLQPLRNNNDPLSIYMGNPDLKVGFRHNMGVSHVTYKPLKGRYLYNSFSLTLLPNAIVNFSTIDKGKTVNMPVNVTGNRSWSYFGYWSIGQGDKKLIHGVDYSISGGRNINYLNGKENINNYTNFYLYYGIRYNVTDKWSVSLSPFAQRNISKSSLNKTVNNNYWTYGGRANAYVRLWGNIDLSTDVDANLQQKTRAFTNPVRIILWNAELKRKFFKDKSFEAAIVAHDILNQNIGLTRTINTNFMNEERFDRISQYFLLRLTWTITKMPGSN